MARKLAVNQIARRNRMRLRQPNHVATQALDESCAHSLRSRRIEAAAWPQRPGSEVPRFKYLLHGEPPVVRSRHAPDAARQAAELHGASKSLPVSLCLSA